MFVTGLGSMPGDDFAGAVRWVIDELGPHAFVPQLPHRGVGAAMVGQAVALLDGLGADLQPSGWRLIPGSGADQRRARALWRRDLDELEEAAQGYQGDLTVAVCGPWTLASSVSRPLGDLVLADHGARRELSQSLASGYAAALAQIARRLPGVQVLAQVDEPMLPSVLDARVPTASGFSRHRRVLPDDAVASLARMVEAVRPSTDRIVLHSCAPGLDLGIVRRAGFSGVAVDARLLTPAGWDAVGQWLDGGHDLWLGAVRTDTVDVVPDVDAVIKAVLGWLRPLELDPALLDSHVALTPACGLGTWTPTAARRLFAVLGKALPLLAEQLVR